MTEAYSTLTVKDFALLFGTEVADIQPSCRDLISIYDFRSRKLSGQEQDAVVCAVLDRLDTHGFTKSGVLAKARWEKGWEENLQEFLKNGEDIKALAPKYLRAGQPVRLFGAYVMPFDSLFEQHWREVYREWLFGKYFKDAPVVYEFGCGTGLDLAYLAQRFPQKELHGFDWVEQSRMTVDLLAKKYGFNMQGHVFDMFSPQSDVVFQKEATVFTFSALEQVGRDFEPFLEFLLRIKPRLVVNIEHISELFDAKNTFDSLALRVINERNYLRGFLTSLKERSAAGALEIQCVHRVPFGSLYVEGYSYTIWRPR